MLAEMKDGLEITLFAPSVMFSSFDNLLGLDRSKDETWLGKMEIHPAFFRNSRYSY
jgi:hypothetical protein